MLKRPVTRYSVLLLAALAAVSMACGGLLDGLTTTEEAVPASPVPETEPPAADQGGKTAPSAESPAADQPPSDQPPAEGPSNGGGINASNASALGKLKTVNASESQIYAGANSPLNHEVATFGFDKIIRVWDGDTGDLLRELRGSAEYGYGLAYSPDGSILASSGGYHVLLWDAFSGQLLHDVIVNSFVFRVVWSPSGDRLAVVGDNSSKIEFIDPSTGTLVSSETLFNPTREILWAVAYSPDASLVAVADGEGDLSVLEPASGDIIFEDSSTASGAAWDLEWSPDGGLLASCNSSGGVWIWETTNWTITLSGEDLHPGGCTDGVFTPNSEVYLGVGNDGYVNAWDAASGDLLSATDLRSALWTVTISGDGNLVAVTDDVGLLHLMGVR